MKTGRLLKFHRPGGDVHAYLYLDGGEAVAAIYVMADGHDPGAEPRHRLRGASEAEVERDLRAWVDTHFPRHP